MSSNSFYRCINVRKPNQLDFLYTLTVAGTSCQHPARVIGSLGWHKVYWSVYRVLGIEDGHWTVFTLHTQIHSLTKTHLLDCPKTKQQQRDNVLKQQQQ